MSGLPSALVVGASHATEVAAEAESLSAKAVTAKRAKEGNTNLATALDAPGVVPESETVLQASNQGIPAIHMNGSDVAAAYSDVVARFLGEQRDLRFVQYEKPGLLKRLFGGR